jgi:hypothetical protein
LEISLLDNGAKSLQDSDTKKKLANAGGKVVVGIFKTVMKGGFPDAAIWTGLREAAVALREGTDHAVASAVFMTGMYARYATLDLTREVAQLTRDVGKKGNSIKRDALVQIRNRLGAAYQMSVGRSKNARQVVLLWIELLGLLVCGDAMASTEQTEDIVLAGGVPCPEILILLWEGFDGMVDDIETPQITVIKDQLEQQGGAAVAETKRAAHDAAISVHQEMEKAAKHEVGKAFHGLKHFLEYGVKDAAFAASGTIAFPLSLVSIGTDLATNPGGLLERMANVANWLFQETTLRLEREIVELLETQSQQIMKLAKKQHEKDIQEIAQDIESGQEQVAETKQAISDTIQQGKDNVLQQAREIEGQVVTKTNAALQEAHASAQISIAAALISAKRKIDSAQEWSEISETQIKSMRSAVTQIKTFQRHTFQPMQNHVTTLESMSEKVAHALHGAVALAHSSIGQAQQDATQKITDFARERLKEMLIILDKAIEKIIDNSRDAAVNKLMVETPQVAAQATKTSIDARNTTLAVATDAKSAAQCAIVTLDEMAFLLSKIEDTMVLLSGAKKRGITVKDGLTKAAANAAATKATDAKAEGTTSAEDGIKQHILTKVQRTKTVCQMLSSKCNVVVKVTTAAGQHAVPTKEDMRNTIIDLKMAVTDLTKELNRLNMNFKGAETAVWDELVNSASSEIQKLTKEVGNTIAGELGNSVNAASDAVNQAAVCADKIHNVTLGVGSHLRVLSSGISTAVSSIEHALSKVEASHNQLKDGIKCAEIIVQHVKKQNQDNVGVPSIQRIMVQKQLERRLLEVEELVVDQIRVVMSAVGASQNVQQKKAEMQKMSDIFGQTKDVLHGLLEQAKSATKNNDDGTGSADSGDRESSNGSLSAVLAICGKVGESMARRAQELRQACKNYIQEAATKLQQHATKFLTNAARDAMDAIGMSSEQGKQIMAGAQNIAKFALRTFIGVCSFVVHDCVC